MRLFCLALVLVLAVPGAGAVQAATVAILAPASPPPLLVETLVRLQGELASVGLGTTVMNEATTSGASADPSSPPKRVQALAARGDLDAVVTFELLASGAAPSSIQTWVFDKGHARILARRVALTNPAELTPSTLAIRAIELLRSSFLELDWASRPRELVAGAPPSTLTEPPAVVAPPVAPARTFDVELGGGLLFGPGGQPTTLAPLLRVGWLPRERWLVDLSISGFGTRPRLSSVGGTAELAQRYGGAGVWRRFRAARALEPVVGFAVGILSTSVHGEPASANEGRDLSQWSVLFEARAGARVALGSRLFATASGHVLWAEPYPVVRFLGQDVATSAHPSFLATLSLGAWL